MRRNQIQGEIQALGGFSRVHLPFHVLGAGLAGYHSTSTNAPDSLQSSACPTASGSFTQSHPSGPEPTHGATLVPPLHVLPSELITTPHTFSRVPPPHWTLDPHSGKCTIIPSGIQGNTQSFKNLPLPPTHIQPITKLWKNGFLYPSTRTLTHIHLFLLGHTGNLTAALPKPCPSGPPFLLGPDKCQSSIWPCLPP